MELGVASFYKNMDSTNTQARFIVLSLCLAAAEKKASVAAFGCSSDECCSDACVHKVQN
jgi:hypothetical protein